MLLILAGVTIATLTGENGIITKAQEAKNKTEEAAEKEKNDLAELENYMNGIEGYSEEFGVNVPNLQEGMIPVYYDDENGVWRKADETNKGTEKWYDYEAKQWANIVTVADENANLRNEPVGTIIPMESITTFFVWIPRYAYSITEGYKQGSTEDIEVTGKIDITFLKGSTNVGSDNVTYETDYDASSINAGEETPKIVHPGFTSGSRQLTGIWVAKFEASGLNGSGEIVGNASSTSSGTASTTGAYVRILPSVPSWRHITIGESEYQSMKMSSNTEKYGWTSSVNSHLIKNSEWGAVAYLCYSDYGSIPKTNGSGSYNSGVGYYNMYTGAGPASTTSEGRYENFTEETHGYNTENGVLSSTTGNVYGVYDMAGGAWERVAAYLDNGNSNLNNTGNSSNEKYFVQDTTQTVTITSGQKTITTYKLKEEYTNYWDKYEVSSTEKAGTITVGEEILTQDELYNKIGERYNEVKKNMVDETWNKLANYKGIGANETINEHSFYAPYTDTNNKTQWSWWTDTTTRNTARTWNNDYMLIGSLSYPFVYRGGSCYHGSGAGVLCWNATNGWSHHDYGFRPVLVF